VLSRSLIQHWKEGGGSTGDTWERSRSSQVLHEHRPIVLGMRFNPAHASEDPDLVRELVRDHPWAVIVSNGPSGLVASHYPVLLDTDGELTLVTHVGRPDERLHGFGGSDVLVILQGTHGYVSPSWYAAGSVKAPTWNFTAAHLWGTPQILTHEENLDVLTRLVGHFEHRVDQPMWLDREYGDKLARGTVGLRIPITRFTLKVKLSQDKDPTSVEQVIKHLRRPGPYENNALAEDMERARARGIGYSRS
jgi:transcriptional regulator